MPHACRGCRHPELVSVFSLGKMPLVNAFILPEETDAEKRFPLELEFCSRCSLVQLSEEVPPKQLFSQYLHMSSASASNLDHLSSVAARMKDLLGSVSKKVLEVGSNDGSLLVRLKSEGFEVLGVDPAENLAVQAEASGVDFITAFFNESLGQRLGALGGFDGIVALNVVAHTPDFLSLLRGVRAALRPRGRFMMEAAYAVDTILQGQFDTVYHEHMYCFSLSALSFALNECGFRILDAEKIPTQGSSIRVIAARLEDADETDVLPSVSRILADERAQGFTAEAAYQPLDAQIRKFRDHLRNRLGELTARYGKVIGVGAPARGVVLMNYCGITPELMEYVIDDTPLKQGRLMPGNHVPVRGWDGLEKKSGSVFFAPVLELP